MKKRLFIYATTVGMFLIIFTLQSVAQQQPDSIRLQKQLQKIVADLNVSEQKAVDIQKALNYNHNQIKATLRIRSITPEDRLQLIKKLEAERQAKINEVLTPGQQQMLREHHEKARGKREGISQKKEQHNKEQLQHPVSGGYSDTSSTKVKSRHQS